MASFYMGGVTGMGMAPLAAFLSDTGNTVRGFDDTPDPEVASYLAKHGVEIEPPEGDLRAYDAVVISTALKRRIGEFVEAGAKSVQFRGQCWAQICRKRRLAAVIGSHGKSTVSALCAHAINKMNTDAGWLVGAFPNDFEMHRSCAEGRFLISEIDESDGTIEGFEPEYVAALNADLDHTDTYADWSSLKCMFERLFSRTKKAVFFPESDAVLSEVAGKFADKARPLKISDDFNRTNKIFARALLEEIFHERLPDDIFDDFGGLRRRQETIYKSRNCTVVADYAHHPSELRAFLKLFNGRYLDAKRTVVFQPHRYSRTKSFARDFAEILDGAADSAQVILAPVYAASESFDPCGSSENIAGACKNKSIILANSGEIFNILSRRMANGGKSAIAIVGAGDIYFETKNFLKDKKCQK